MPPSKIKLTLKNWRAKRRNRLLQQVIPAEGTEDVEVEADRTSSKYLNRPGFSIPLMTTNFRRFNARYGINRYGSPSILRALTLPLLESGSFSSSRTDSYGS
jgi:hypothetical protein